MNYLYSDERNVQIVLALLKEYGIKRVIASPGAINIPVVASMQQDPYFEMFSWVDERSAAYVACGLAEETGEPVVLSCTGATSSRNYMPGLTEAFYRKLPVIALTSSRDSAWIGHLYPQVTNRLEHPKDICVDFEHIQTVKDKTDEWDVTIKVNRALNAVKNGPIHLNITDAVNHGHTTQTLPRVKKIRVFKHEDQWPELPKGRIVIFCGEHKQWSDKLTAAVDRFCSCHDAVVYCDHTSKYHGKYRVLSSLIGAQEGYNNPVRNFDLIIHIGEVSGAYDVFDPIRGSKSVWRVSEDGQLRDFFRKLDAVFEDTEYNFFTHYATDFEGADQLLALCKQEYTKIYESIPELPFSNMWIGKTIGNRIPDGSILYLGILNTLRTWNFFEINPNVRTYSNVGGFGIDGIVSSMIGASLADPKRLCFATLGDLSFFYDMNSIGNREVGKNIRIMLINNGKGIEFRHYNHHASFMGESADEYVAAARHWGNKSNSLVKHYSEDLGFKYLSASNKEEFNAVIDQYLNPEYNDKPILFEIFTTTEDEMDSLRLLRTANKPTPTVVESVKSAAKKALKDAVGKKGMEIINIITK